MAPTFQNLGPKNRTNYHRQLGRKNNNVSATINPSTDIKVATIDTEKRAEYRRMKQVKSASLDAKFLMENFSLESIADADTKRQDINFMPLVLQRRGWLFNMLPTSVSVNHDKSTGTVGGLERSGLDLFFCSESGENFKATILYRPYFYVILDLPKELNEQNHLNDSNFVDGNSSQCNDIITELLITSLTRLFDGFLHNIETVHRIDLDQPNHLSPKNRHGRQMLKLIFDNVTQLIEVRSQIRDIIMKNHQRGSLFDVAIFTTTTSESSMSVEDLVIHEPLRLLQDIREYDVPYVVRVCTDLEIRAGTWYTVCLEHENFVATIASGNQRDDTGGVKLTDPDRESKAEPTFLAFDIECTKAPLKFPSAEVDEIFMISYMVSSPTGGKGYLIVSRSIVSQDIDDFEYTPKPSFPGPFHIFNEDNEHQLLERFFSEFEKHHPQIVVTYNGDFFDWPFIETRAKVYGMEVYERIGIEKTNEGYRGRCCVHMDAFHWVQRDSYLPQGAQGLKAVTKNKLKYDPVEVDPEDMVLYAREKPVHMATYSVSDAVATYYLYEKYVHLFIFSLCTIIPMGPEDVLCKGSGTLCEMLLMVQACRKSIICPNKHVDEIAQFHNGHLLESETYIGGKVECLETGVYRSDIEYDFRLQPSAFQHLIDNIDRDLNFAIKVESGKDRNDVLNYDLIRSEIVNKLELLRDTPTRREKPYIYHLDVGAMYPNIILTNRLQPSSMVSDATCAACDFNQAKNECKRRMDWVWRGEFNPATYREYERTKNQLTREKMSNGSTFNQLSEREQARIIASRLKTYANKAYKKTKITQEQTRTNIVCMRENDFYVGTVREFRDRRYEYKRMNKTWNKKREEATDAASKKFCDDKILVYDSLQIAHKCILNSFYGYVMRKGARWRSMEMAGIVTKTGSDIITQARILVDQIGRPLELDTDGIWCILPCSFPDVFSFELVDGSKMKLEYPCVMLNADVHAKFTNHQYHTLVDAEKGIFQSQSECSIFFEVDGPYRCMVIPASTEEGKLLKKRYAVFNHDGSLAELKGFELKRRGELELIKTFQAQVFERFLHGSNLKECYDAVAEVANHWIDVIDTRGVSLDDDELVDLISENRSMSRQLDDYGDQKGTSQTTARRLSEFLGAEIIKDKGLNCKFIISEQPFGTPVTDRAIPTAIWKAEPGVMKYYLRKWLKAPGLDGDGFDIRNVLDWDYYLERLAKTIQKIITIPAALQKVQNPVPRIEHPSWLESKICVVNDKFQQRSITSMFPISRENVIDERGVIGDMEDTIALSNITKRPTIIRHDKKLNPSITRNQVIPDEFNRTELSESSFNNWLEQRKAAWKQLRMERRSKVKPDQGGLQKKQRNVKSVEGLARNAAVSVTQEEWHIFEVRQMSSLDSTQTVPSSGSGEFIVWAMTGSESLQKIIVTAPRVIYLSSRSEITSHSDEIIYCRRVSRYLPHGKSTTFLYEIAMPEYIYKARQWFNFLYSSEGVRLPYSQFESLFESGTPLLTRVLSEIGSTCKLSPTASRLKNKSFYVSDIVQVDRPKEGEYLAMSISYQRMFLYVRINPKAKTGIVALYFLHDGSGSFNRALDFDITRPTMSTLKNVDITSTCRVWIIKPYNGQKGISMKQAEKVTQDTIKSVAGIDAEYGCIDPKSQVNLTALNFVATCSLAYASANESISMHAKSFPGPMVILINSSVGIHSSLRRHMSTLSSFPVIPLAFPPFPDHNPSLTALPSLNWELPAFQLSFEALIHMLIVSFPSLVAYARYGHVPLGNLGGQENNVLYEVSLMRLIQKNRALSWANLTPGTPDLGVMVVPTSDHTFCALGESGSFLYNHEEIWGDDDELVCPVIRKPGYYRSICVNIDLQDLTVAAMTSIANVALGCVGAQIGSTNDPSSPSSVTLFGNSVNVTNVMGPLGDDMATAISLPILRALVSGWLKDAIMHNSIVADELLHHVYVFLSNPENLFYDPALHRVIHSLMKSSFIVLMSELQRLGCSIVYASFHKVIVATNKTELADAEEYINFVIDTARRQSNDGSDRADILPKLSLKPRQFHSNFLFLDEYNYGTVHLERVAMKDLDEASTSFSLCEGSTSTKKIVPSVITEWSIMNYLGSKQAQEYFRVIMGRYSKDIFCKQVDIVTQASTPSLGDMNFTCNEMIHFKKNLILNNFATILTRAVGEIMEAGIDDIFSPPLLCHMKRINPALEFIKNVVTVLSLDSHVEKEVQSLKRSLFAQVGIAEYSKQAQWVNPCPMLMLPDVFCVECRESRNVNLCYIPTRALDEELDKRWICDDCSTPYNTSEIECRLVQKLQRKIVRYHLQDLRCSKTSRVSSRALAFLSEKSTSLKLDTARTEMINYLQLLRNIANFHDLEVLKSILDSISLSFTF